MAEKPIICSGSTVPAIQDDRKTQTRRVIVPQPKHLSPVRPYFNAAGKWSWVLADTGMGDGTSGFPCPYGQPGDRLWVKEGYRIVAPGVGRDVSVEYLADGYTATVEFTAAEWGKWSTRKYPFRKAPGRFMYKSLARIWLEVVRVRVQRVQEISEEDAQAEGVMPQKTVFIPHPLKRKSKPRFWTGATECSHRESFQILWDSINGRRPGCTWADNCWVWAIDFKLLELANEG